MIDILYLLLTVAFFAGMLAYVAGCARLGSTAQTETATTEETAR